MPVLFLKLIYFVVIICKLSVRHVFGEDFYIVAEESRWLTKLFPSISNCLCESATLLVKVHQGLLLY